MSSPGSYIRLETTGRQTGRPHGVILRYVALDGRVFVFAQKGRVPDWVLNIEHTARVRVLGEGRMVEGMASRRRAAGYNDPVLRSFARKYGQSTVKSRYWGQMEYVEIQPSGDEEDRDLDELVYGDLEAAFDGVASDYDRHIFGNPINVWLRNRSVRLLTRVFRRGETVLEVGCGTGTETIALAKAGIRVVATDISSKMVDVLRRHAEEAAVGDLVIPIHSRPYELKERLRERGYAQVDGVYSTYGAVNTEPRLAEFFLGLHSLTRGAGSLVLGVWNRYCLYEMLGYMLKANPSMALARFRNPVPLGKSRFCVSTNAYSVGDISAALAGLFSLKEVRGVGIFLPPSNLTKYLPPRPFVRLSQWSDVAVEGHPPWNRLGDHFLAVYSRIP